MPTLGSHTCWIIGYGNHQRRDDGIGPFVVDKLKGLLKQKTNVRLLALSQLRADLVEELRGADLILFVDATFDDLEGGRAWIRLHPETKLLPYLTHHIHPSFLLGLVQSLYNRSPAAWLVSIQGCNFGIGEGLSLDAENRAEEASSEIARFIDKKDRKKQIENDIYTGVSHGKRNRYPYY